MKYYVLPIFLFILGLGCEQKPHMASIDGNSLKAHLVELSSDVYLGRKPFGPGDIKTITYLKDRLESMGVKPGNGDSYFQDVPMVEISGHPDNTMQISGGKKDLTFDYKEDFVSTTLQIREDIRVSNSEMVFCGYGIVAPEYGKDDYQGIDMKGKTAVVLVNDPGFGTEDEKYFKGNTMTYYGRWTYKYEEAARQGASAIMIIHEVNMAGYPWFVVEAGWSGGQLHLRSENNNQDRCELEGWITLDAAKQLMESADLDFAALIQQAKTKEFKPTPMGLTLSHGLKNTFKYDESKNVVGMIPGTSDPEEYIIYSAHWDHLGVGQPVNGDSIYNGALDNGSGTAALLSIAEAFSTTHAPKRSIVFLFVTAEEQGLLGSAYYAANPIFPVATTIANINMDALNPSGEMKDLTVTGYGQSEMDDIAKEEAARQDRYILPDQEPEKGYFYRSDHFSFAKVGIPALYAQGSYDHREKGKDYAMEMQKEFTSKHYHKPSDEYSDETWDLSGIIQDAQLFYNIGYRLSNGDERPQWKPGSEFKARRDEDLRKAGLKG